MTEVVPAILVKDFKTLNDEISQYVNYTHLIQLDICDGNFVPSLSWPFYQRVTQDNPLFVDFIDMYAEKIINEEEGLPYWDKIDFEFDLMVKNAHKQFDFFVKLGARKIIFHLEAEEENSFKEFLESIDLYIKENVEIGLAINTKTNIEKIFPYINYIDFIQFMGIENIGFQGQNFDEKVFDQIKQFREKYKDVKISIDGGVNKNTAKILKELGVDKFVIGSALKNNIDKEDAIKYFENL